MQHRLLEVITVRKTKKYSKLEFFLMFYVGESCQHFAARTKLPTPCGTNKAANTLRHEQSCQRLAARTKLPTPCGTNKDWG
jgi:hypothetical protein